MANIHGFSEIGKNEKPKGQGYFSGGDRGGVEFYSNDDAAKTYKQTEELAMRNNGNKYHDASKKDFIINVVLYKNGFTVNDGPLREYNTPENKQFVADVKEGYIPKEYEEEAQRSNIAMNMTDSSQTMYSPKATSSYAARPQPQTFTGTGNVIGK